MAPHCPPEPAETGRLESPRRTEDLVERHSHHLGGGLGDDRVAAGADVGHVGLDRHPALAVEPDAGGRLRHLIVAERGGDAHADQPAPVADLAGLGRTLVPAEAPGADAKALDQLALGEGARGVSGIDLGIVEDAELDRVHSQLFRHLVHGDLQGHQARRLARRPHGIAFRQIEHRQPLRRHPVGAGIEQARLLDRVLGLAIGQIAGPALVADRGDPAVGGGADPDALDGCRPVSGVVADQGPGQRHLHGTPRRPRAKYREQGVGPQEQFAAEAAADKRRDEAYLVLGDAKRFRQVADRPVDHLVGGPDGEPITFPRRDRGMRFHHRMRLVGGGVGRVELDRSRGEGAGKVADGGIGSAKLVSPARNPWHP